MRTTLQLIEGVIQDRVSEWIIGLLVEVSVTAILIWAGLPLWSISTTLFGIAFLYIVGRRLPRVASSDNIWTPRIRRRVSVIGVFIGGILMSAGIVGGIIGVSYASEIADVERMTDQYLIAVATKDALEAPRPNLFARIHDYTADAGYDYALLVEFGAAQRPLAGWLATWYSHRCGVQPRSFVVQRSKLTVTSAARCTDETY